MNAKSYIQQLLLSVICRARRIPQFTAGLCIAWICSANSAHALNGFSSVNTCSQCTTTSQFETAAVLAAEAQAKSGVYTMVSTAGPMTAFMQVTGQLVFEYQAHKTVWVATTVVPVDASGNSLAGDTEAEQEAVYTSIDAVIMGTNRNNPEGWPLLFGPTSFGCAGSDCDAAVATAVLLSVPSSAISASKVGDTWTISYKNGDVAQFEVIAKSPVFTLKWNGYAINSKKQRLNRDGSIMDNQNNGGNGSGVINASATPSNPNWSWSLTQGDQCTLTAVAGDPDIGFYTAVIFVPC